MTKYPSQIDTTTSLPPVVDNVTPVQASVFNKLRAAVIAIEEELGVRPRGVYSTVRARLDALETIVGNLEIIELDGDLGGTLETPKVIGIQGRPVSDVEPNFLDSLVWNGIAWIPVPISDSGGGSSPVGPAGGDLSGSYPTPTVIDLTISDEQQGSILYRNATNWVQLAPGTDGQVLTTHDTSNDPTWETVSGSSGNIVYVDTTAGGGGTGTVTSPFNTFMDAHNALPSVGGFIFVLYSDRTDETFAFTKPLSIIGLTYGNDTFEFGELTNYTVTSTSSLYLEYMRTGTDEGGQAGTITAANIYARYCHGRFTTTSGNIILENTSVDGNCSSAGTLNLFRVTYDAAGGTTAVGAVTAKLSSFISAGGITFVGSPGVLYLDPESDQSWHNTTRTITNGTREPTVKGAPIQTISAASTTLSIAHIGMYLRFTHVTPTVTFVAGLPVGSLFTGVGVNGPITFSPSSTTINTEPDLTPVTRGAFAPFALKVVASDQADLTGSLEPAL